MPRPAYAGLVVVASLALTGCMSTAPAPPPEPKPKVRQSVLTAPADLQLLCSAAAARKYNLRRDEILPVGSDAITPDVFQVDIESKGGTYRCVVNRQAVVLELTRV